MTSASAADPGRDPDLPLVVTLCTGNAARSVIAGALLASSGLGIRVITAGTHVVEHQPMSMRTRDAMVALGVEPPRHRSHQLTGADLADAALVMAMSAEHVWYVRRRHPEAAAKVATLRYLARMLPGGPEPLGTRVAGLVLEGVDPASQGDVADPAGGDVAEYVARFREIIELVGLVAPRLEPAPAPAPAPAGTPAAPPPPDLG